MRRTPLSLALAVLVSGITAAAAQGAPVDAVSAVGVEGGAAPPRASIAIVGGTPAAPGQYPSMVAYLDSKAYPGGVRTSRTSSAAGRSSRRPSSSPPRTA